MGKTDDGFDLSKLVVPFSNYKWKVQTANEWGCWCVAYIDARDVQQRLDDVVGPENWQNKFVGEHNLLFCYLGIRIDSGEWIWKSDTGTASKIEKDKGHASDTFKRSAVMWGIGRHLYSLGIQKVKSVKANGKFYPADDAGERLYDKNQLTEFIERRMSGKKAPKQRPKNADPVPPKSDLDEMAPPPHRDYDTPDWKKGIAAVYAKAGENGLDNDSMHGMAEEEFGVSSMKQLSISQLRKLWKMIADGDATGGGK